MKQQILTPTAKYGYIPALDGLRALSVGIVFLAHFGLDHIVPGGLGVTVFFFISGFLITRLLIAEAQTNGKIRIKQFYIRRILRLYPALLFMVLMSSALFGAFGFGGPTWHEFLAALGYGMNVLLALQAHGIGETYMSWNPLWSLAVEEHFYLFFPLLLLAFGHKWKRALWTIAVLLLLTPLWRAFIVFGTNIHADTYTYVMSDARMDSILWGCMASLCLHTYPQILTKKWLIGWIPTIFAVFLFAITLLVRDAEFRNIIRYSIQGLALFLLICNLYFNPVFKFAISALEFAPLAWVGRLSYPLYLWHFVMLDFWGRIYHSQIQIICTALVCSFLAATISLYLIERPMLSLRKRYGAQVIVPNLPAPKLREPQSIS